MTNVTINGKTFAVKKIDFAALVALEDVGLTPAIFAEPQKHSFRLISSLVAYTEDITAEEANAEIENHLLNGGTFDDFTPLIESLEKSDFFTRLAQRAKTQSGASTENNESEKE